MEHSHSQRVLAHCPLCQTTYRAEAVRLLGERGSTRLFHCTCNACGHAVLAVILEAPGTGNVSSVGLVTDLEIQDALRWKDAKTVTSDECVAVHRLMQEGSAGFCRRLLDKAA